MAIALSQLQQEIEAAGDKLVCVFGWKAEGVLWGHPEERPMIAIPGQHYESVEEAVREIAKFNLVGNAALRSSLKLDETQKVGNKIVVNVCKYWILVAKDKCHHYIRAEELQNPDALENILKNPLQFFEALEAKRLHKEQEKAQIKQEIQLLKKKPQTKKVKQRLIELERM